MCVMISVPALPPRARWTSREAGREKGWRQWRWTHGAFCHGLVKPTLVPHPTPAPSGGCVRRWGEEAAKELFILLLLLWLECVYQQFMG